MGKILEHMRWPIIDETSMLNAGFLIQIDWHLRRTRSRLASTKKDAAGQERSFGGVNVILLGDVWQLDPPTGTPLAAAPAEYIRGARRFVPAATTEHGQSLVWGYGEHVGAVQGLTELTECIRCKDPWLREF